MAAKWVFNRLRLGRRLGRRAGLSLPRRSRLCGAGTIAAGRPIKDRGETALDAAGGLGDGAEGVKYGQYVGHVDVGNRDGADPGEDMPFEGPNPLLAAMVATPRAFVRSNEF